MNIILKENETMNDPINRLSFASEWIYSVAPVAYWYENLSEDGRIVDIHFSDRMRNLPGCKTHQHFHTEGNHC